VHSFDIEVGARRFSGVTACCPATSRRLDILRDLKRIHSHICGAAYPALEAAGALAPRRGDAAAGAEAQTPPDYPFDAPRSQR
jgi:hypothetical protein